MAIVIMCVEAFSEDEDVWKPICRQMTGEEEDIRPEAEAIQQQWLDAGWPKDQIRISKSAFREFGKMWRED